MNYSETLSRIHGEQPRANELAVSLERLIRQLSPEGGHESEVARIQGLLEKTQAIASSTHDHLVSLRAEVEAGGIVLKNIEGATAGIEKAKDSHRDRIAGILLH